MLKRQEIEEIRNRINLLTEEGREFLFLIDYEKTGGYLVEDPMNNKDVLFSVGDKTNVNKTSTKNTPFRLEPHPISLEEYKKQFKVLETPLKQGYISLANLTLRTKIETDLSPEEIFERSRAMYRIYIKDELICFSPERFIRIEDGIISTHPMKGTIPANIPDAERLILNNPKEIHEHSVMIESAKQELATVSNNVEVSRYRYIDEIKNNKGGVLQVSSEITGELRPELGLGDIIVGLLPVGSISGIPKHRAIGLIEEAEGIERGFYTGVFGYFDGRVMDTGVMIRLIEITDGNLYFRSGGGITKNSRAEDEYQEIVDKIYLPF